MSCLDTTKYHCFRCKVSTVQQMLTSRRKQTKFQVGKLKSLFRIVCLARKNPSEEKMLSQPVCVPFSLFRSRKNVLYFEPARAYYVCMNHHC